MFGGWGGLRLPGPAILLHGVFKLITVSGLALCLTEKGELAHLVTKYYHAAVKVIKIINLRQIFNVT